jgi:hypothetical protein
MYTDVRMSRSTWMCGICGSGLMYTDVRMSRSTWMCGSDEAANILLRREGNAEFCSRICINDIHFAVHRRC